MKMGQINRIGPLRVQPLSGQEDERATYKQQPTQPTAAAYGYDLRHHMTPPHVVLRCKPAYCITNHTSMNVSQAQAYRSLDSIREGTGSNRSRPPRPLAKDRSTDPDSIPRSTCVAHVWGLLGGGATNGQTKESFVLPCASSCLCSTSPGRNRCPGRLGTPSLSSGLGSNRVAGRPR